MKRGKKNPGKTTLDIVLFPDVLIEMEAIAVIK
jgi:hypothetical protein